MASLSAIKGTADLYLSKIQIFSDLFAIFCVTGKMKKLFYYVLIFLYKIIMVVLLVIKHGHCRLQLSRFNKV